MTDALLLFTFSPVQSFIAEARRAADLYTGSKILVKLAQAARENLIEQGGEIIYPAGSTDDVPNKIVAKISWESFDKEENPATKAKSALLGKWKEIAEKAKGNFRNDDFGAIWDRQIAPDYLWEIYWAVAKIENGDYQKAYREAESALQAVKATRAFKQADEQGFKDTLSGKREALHDSRSGRKYWEDITQPGSDFVPIKIRPGGRERLDAIGVIKRFHPELSRRGVAPFNGFPSTSSIASLDYLDEVRADVGNYKKALTKLFGKKAKLMEIRDDEFPYDGDFLYLETLTPKRLQDDYGLENSDVQAYLKSASDELKQLRKLHNDERPSPYYAVIKLDGDDMGPRIRACKTKKEHEEFSKALSKFAEEVRKLASDKKYHACIIYNGGDDVLAMASLSKAVEFVKAMAEQFKEIMKEWGATASAGIVVTHHLSPLSNALRQVQKAEEKAKEQEGKNSVCVTVLRRSGETLQMVSKWDQMDNFPVFVKLFTNKELSAKLPYDIAQASYALPVANPMSAAEIKRLVKRHGAPKIDERDETKRQERKKKWIEERANDLNKWAENLPREFLDREYQIEGLANWLSLARFVSQGGRT